MSIYSVNILSVCLSVMLQSFATYWCFHPCSYSNSAAVIYLWTSDSLPFPIFYLICFNVKKKFPQEIHIFRSNLYNMQSFKCSFIISYFMLVYYWIIIGFFPYLFWAILKDTGRRASAMANLTTIQLISLILRCL